MDILLCPWTEEATDPATVVEAICQHIGGFAPGGKSHEEFNGYLDIASVRPHGRLAYAFYFDRASAKRQRGPYLDISVMPLKRK